MGWGRLDGWLDLTEWMSGSIICPTAVKSPRGGWIGDNANLMYLMWNLKTTCNYNNWCTHKQVYDIAKCTK